MIVNPRLADLVVGRLKKRVTCMKTKLLLAVVEIVRKNKPHEEDCLQSRSFGVARHFRIQEILAC